MDKQHVTLLHLLDFSIAFDTVDPNTLLKQLQNSFGIQGKVLLGLKSYLSCHSQCISEYGSLSRIFKLECGIPQGSCLGPLLFTLTCLYTSRLFDIIQTHLPEVLCFADDTRLYLSFSPSNAINQLSAISAMESCIDDIRLWMLTDSLKLKSEILIIGMPQQLAKIDIHSIQVGNCNVSPATSARNLGSWLTPSFQCLLRSQSCPVLPFISLQYSAYTEISLKVVYWDSCACVYYC